MTTNSAACTKFHYSQFSQTEIKPRLNLKASLKPTRHAVQACKTDRYGQARLPNRLPLQYRIDELEQQEGRDSKYVIRYKVSKDLAQTIVIRPTSEDEYLIVTTWLNKLDDNHSSLKNSSYSDISLLK